MEFRNKSKILSGHLNKLRKCQVVVEDVQDRKPDVTASYTGESGFSFGVRGAQHLEAQGRVPPG